MALTKVSRGLLSTSIVDNGNATAITIDSSENVGVGTSSPSNYYSTTLVVDAPDEDGITVVNPTTGTGYLMFADGTSGNARYRGYIAYSHSADVMQLATSGLERIRIDSSGQLLLGRGANVAAGAEATRIQFYNTNSSYDIASIRSLVGAGQVNRGELSFAVNNGAGQQERMRIDYSGNLLVGTTDVSASAGEGIKLRASSNAKTISTVSSRSTSADEGITMWSTGANTWRFYVGWGGQINATSNTINAISDQRFKENIRDLDDGLSKVMELRPRKFDWKEGKGADIKDDRGFIAQEFEEVFPDLVGEWKDEAPEGEEPYKAVSQDLIPTLVKAIQEQQTLIESLTARIAALEE
jgi:hypothetical protein